MFKYQSKIIYEEHSGINCHTALFTSENDVAISKTFCCNDVNLLLTKWVFKYDFILLQSNMLPFCINTSCVYTTSLFILAFVSFLQELYSGVDNLEVDKK